MSTVRMAREYVRLTRERKMMKAKLKKVEEKLNELEPLLHESMITDAVENISVDSEPALDGWDYGEPDRDGLHLVWVEGTYAIGYYDQEEEDWKVDGFDDQLQDVEYYQDLPESPLDASTRGAATVYIREDIWPKLRVLDGETKEEARKAAVELLEDMGHEEVITYNNTSVRSIMTELLVRDPETGELVVDEPLGDRIEPDVRYKVGVRGA